jgi:predicted anti-sigma-YlaC factor YlaD
MQTMDCGETRMSLGVYVLGAIDPAERALVDAHLSACQDCRDELAGLAGLPALLSRVGLDEVLAMSEDGPAEDTRPGDAPAMAPAGQAGDRPQPKDRQGDSGAEPLVPGAEPPPELLGAVLDLTAARRRRRTWRTAGLSAAAAVVIAAGAFGGAQLTAGNGSTGVPPVGQESLNYGSPLSGWTSVHGSSNGMAATVMYQPMGWGTKLAVKVVGIPIGTPCQLVTIGTDGTRTVVGGWTTDNVEGTIFYPASAPVSPEQIREYQITIMGHQPITIPA